MTESAHGKPWSREHTLAAFVLYMRLPPDKLERWYRPVISFAEAIGRTPASVAYKLRNIQFYDPNKVRVGNSHASQRERAIWDEYAQRGDNLLDDAIIEYMRLMKPKKPVEYEGSVNITTTPEGVDIVTVTTRRLHQDHFRKNLMYAYDGKCCVTGLASPELLVASHIKPWRNSDPYTERVNVENGLLLNSLHDKAFDCGLISLSNDFEILISEELEEHCSNDKDEASSLLCGTRGRKITYKEEYKPNLEFIEYHREHVFRG